MNLDRIFLILEKAKVIGKIDLPQQKTDRITRSDLAHMEKVLDKLFHKIGVDFEIKGRHFLDRLNDDRNNPEIW